MRDAPCLRRISVNYLLMAFAIAKKYTQNIPSASAKAQNLRERLLLMSQHIPKHIAPGHQPLEYGIHSLDEEKQAIPRKSITLPNIEEELPPRYIATEIEENEEITDTSSIPRIPIQKPAHMEDMSSHYVKQITLPDELEPRDILSIAATLAILFALTSIVGWISETIADGILHHAFVLRRYFLLPWCPIYGFICVCSEIILGRWKAPRMKRTKKDMAIRIASNIAMCIAIAIVIATISSFIIPYLELETPDIDHCLELTKQIWPHTTIRYICISCVTIPYITTFIAPSIYLLRRSQLPNLCAIATIIVLLLIADTAILVLGLSAQYQKEVALCVSTLTHWPVTIQEL